MDSIHETPKKELIVINKMRANQQIYDSNQYHAIEYLICQCLKEVKER